jgi:hypothetical protein
VGGKRAAHGPSAAHLASPELVYYDDVRCVAVAQRGPARAGVRIVLSYPSRLNFHFRPLTRPTRIYDALAQVCFEGVGGRAQDPRHEDGPRCASVQPLRHDMGKSDCALSGWCCG